MFQEEGKEPTPFLRVEEEPKQYIGKYGELRRQYLLENNLLEYSLLKGQNKLWKTLAELNEAAMKREDEIVEAMARSEGTDEKMMATDQMKWVGLMTNYRYCAMEIILNEMIYI
jgi:hypothetical protein